MGRDQTGNRTERINAEQQGDKSFPEPGENKLSLGVEKCTEQNLITLHFLERRKQGHYLQLPTNAISFIKPSLLIVQ